MLLSADFPSGEAFLAHFDPRGPGRFVMPFAGGALPAAPALGDAVEVRLTFPGCAFDIRARAQVVERRPGESPPGWVVELAPGQEPRRELIVSCARGEKVPVKARRSTRYPAGLKVTLLLPQGKDSGRTFVVSDGGMGLQCAAAHQPGEEVRVRVWTAGLLLAWPSTLAARVTSCEPGPEGFRVGLALVFSSPRQRARWHRVVAAAAARG